MFVKPLNRFVEEEGNLFPLEFNVISFEPKRIFYVTDVPKGEERGLHAHYKTKQVLICVQGKILIKLHNGKKETQVILNVGDSIFVDKMIWDSQIYLTGKDILLSLCSTAYDQKDYINDFEEFISKTT